MTVRRHWCLRFQPIHSFSGHALACYCSVTSVSLWPLDCSTPGSPSFTTSQSLLELPSVELLMPSNQCTGDCDTYRNKRWMQVHPHSSWDRGKTCTGHFQICDGASSVWWDWVRKASQRQRLRTEAWGEAAGTDQRPGGGRGDQTDGATHEKPAGRAASHTHRRHGGLQTRSTRMGRVLRQKHEVTQLQREAGCKAQEQRWGIPRTPAKSSHGDDCMPGRLVCSPYSLPARAPFPPREPKGRFCHVMRYNRPSLQGHTQPGQISLLSTVHGSWDP